MEGNILRIMKLAFYLTDRYMVKNNDHSDETATGICRRMCKEIVKNTKNSRQDDNRTGVLGL